MGRLARLAAAHGVSVSYEPAPGRTAEVPEETVVAVLAALGVDASTPRALHEALERRTGQSRALLPPTVVLRTGLRPGGRRNHGGLRSGGPLSSLPEGTVLRVLTESGETLDWGPGTELPPGVHALRVFAPDGRAAHATLIAAPDRLPVPHGRAARGRAHGLLVQLYSVLSARSWGMGDLADLAELASWAGRSLGSDFVQLNPLHSAVPSTAGRPTDPSPYRPSSRCFPDPVHLRVEAVPEYAYLDRADRVRADALLTRAAALRDAVLRKDALIDRDAVRDLKRKALELVRRVPLGPGRHAAFCDFLAARGRALEDHATWCALAELHGPDWRSWPSGLDDPRSARTAAARREHIERVDFHCWLAWLTDTQLAEAQGAARDAGMAVGLVHDLAVGVDPSGADVWARRDAFAEGITVGAPPDAFTARGQDWGLPPWNPEALAASGYAPYREVLQGQFRHAGGLRVDHVMGHSRLWWIPEGRPPTDGTYVRYDTEAMLGVLALEAHRAGAVVIGEDLGTVEPGVREDLAERRVLGTSVLWFERAYEEMHEAYEEDEADDEAARAAEQGPEEVDASAAGVSGPPRPLAPGEWRAACLATATTHDLPSTAARLAGEDVALRHRLGLLDRPLAAERAGAAADLERWLACFRRLGLLPEGVGDEEGEVKAVHRFLARTPARLVGVWLPDAVGDRRAQNVPGTTDEHPNWRLPLAGPSGVPMTLEELTASPRARALFAALSEELGPAGPER